MERKEQYIKFMEIAEKEGWATGPYNKEKIPKNVYLYTAFKIEMELEVEPKENEGYIDAFKREYKDKNWIRETVIHYVMIAPRDKEKLNDVGIYKDMMKYKNKVDKLYKKVNKVK